MFAPVAARNTPRLTTLAVRRARRLSRRDRARSLAEMGDWAKLIAGFVAALAILMPVALMVGYSLA